jgi:hypothetical protein
MGIHSKIVKTKYNKQVATVVCVALMAFNKSSIDDLMMQKAVADRIHTLVGDVVPSNAVVSQVSALLADHSQRYDTSGKPRSDLFVVDANPNISVFDSLMTYSLLRVLGKHGSPCLWWQNLHWHFFSQMVMTKYTTHLGI